jgi:hypothetical protein
MPDRILFCRCFISDDFAVPRSPRTPCRLTRKLLSATFVVAKQLSDYPRLAFCVELLDVLIVVLLVHAIIVLCIGRDLTGSPAFENASAMGTGIVLGCLCAFPLYVASRFGE